MFNPLSVGWTKVRYWFPSEGVHLHTEKVNLLTGSSFCVPLPMLALHYFLNLLQFHKTTLSHCKYVYYTSSRIL